MPPKKRKMAEENADEPAPKRQTRGKGKKPASEDEDVQLDEVVEVTPRQKSARQKDKAEGKQTDKQKLENPFALTWVTQGSLLVLTDTPGSGVINHNAKIAAFDMDSTLICTKSGRTFAQGRSDWQWLFDEVPAKLKELHKAGFKIVIFTNQGGIGTGTTSAAAIQGKILDIIKDLGVPVQAFVATSDDLFRKPSPHMWTEALCKFNANIKPDLKQSTYCGDAAGRAANWDGSGRKKDFSCDDRKFAKNVGVQFHTPEEFFLGQQPAPFDWRGFDVDMFLADTNTSTSSSSSSSSDSKSNGENKKEAKGETKASTTATTGSGQSVDGDIIPAGTGQEIVVFVGFPAAGKSTFARKHFVPKGYVHVNQDTLKNKDKCIRVARESVEAGHSVVVDNTNPGKDLRNEYLKIAKAAGIPCRCFEFTTPEDMSKHLNIMREKLIGHKHVPRIAYNVFKKNFVAPSVGEGFVSVTKVKFVPEFTSEAHKKAFSEMA